MKSHDEISECPFRKNISPSEVLSAESAPQTTGVPATHPAELDEGWRNLYRIQSEGPFAFFSRMNQSAQQPFFKVKLGPKDVYQIADGAIGEELLSKYAKQLGRGSLLVPFKSMVGDVFFANDGQKAADTRKVFLKTVTRFKDNFQRINQVNERTIESAHLSADKINDLFAFVAYHTIGCIAKCFVGVDDLSTIPENTHATFLKATRQIAQASMDPVSRVIHPYLRSEFRAASYAMASIANELLEKNIDAICKGNNYTWDLAVFRAKELHPEMNFDHCKHYDEQDPQSKIVRDLIVSKDRFVLEHGPLTIFASSNVGASLYFLIDTLSRRVDVIEKMRDEVKNVLGGQPFTHESSRDLPYVHAVVQEALWQATPIPSFPREVLSPFEAEINGQTISFKQGDMLMLQFRPMQGTTGEFLPERWLGGDNGPAPHLYSFGVGHRRCPAQAFAKQLLSQFLVNMITHNLYIVPTTRTEYTTRNGTLGPNYLPDKPVVAEMKPIPLALTFEPVAQKI
ncbi:MAG TPA: cytochrome P450 [Gammaproteobacteria bacterium]|jgi:cytochrome P450|nr:cytochrome P450 [Gammaproteobacteria bacterium]